MKSPYQTAGLPANYQGILTYLRGFVKNIAIKCIRRRVLLFAKRIAKHAAQPIPLLAIPRAAHYYLYRHSSTSEDLFADLEDLPAQAIVALDHVGDFIAAIHYRGVVAPTQGCADLGQRNIRGIAQEIHGYLAGKGYFTCPVAACQPFCGNAKGRGNGRDHLVGLDG